MAEHRLSTRRVTGLAGLATAVVFGAGSALWGFQQPDPGAPALAMRCDSLLEEAPRAYRRRASHRTFIFRALSGAARARRPVATGP